MTHDDTEEDKNNLVNTAAKIQLHQNDEIFYQFCIHVGDYTKVL